MSWADFFVDEAVAIHQAAVEAAAVATGGVAAGSGETPMGVFTG